MFLTSFLMPGFLRLASIRLQFCGKGPVLVADVLNQWLYLTTKPYLRCVRGDWGSRFQGSGRHCDEEHRFKSDETFTKLFSFFFCSEGHFKKFFLLHLPGEFEPENIRQHPKC